MTQAGTQFLQPAAAVAVDYQPDMFPGQERILHHRSKETNIICLRGKIDRYDDSEPVPSLLRNPLCIRRSC